MADNDNCHVAELCEGVNSIALFHDKTLYGETSASVAGINIRKHGKRGGTTKTHSAGKIQKTDRHSSANTRNTVVGRSRAASNQRWTSDTYHRRFIRREEIHLQRELSNNNVVHWILFDLESVELTEAQKKKGKAIWDKMSRISTGSLYHNSLQALTVKNIQKQIPAWMTRATIAAGKMKEYNEVTFEWGKDIYNRTETWTVDKTGRRYDIHLV